MLGRKVVINRGKMKTLIKIVRERSLHVFQSSMVILYFAYQKGPKFSTLFWQSRKHTGCNFTLVKVQCRELLFKQSPCYLLCKRPNLTLLFYYIKVPPHSHPKHPTLSFTWALEWGTGCAKVKYTRPIWI